MSTNGSQNAGFSKTTSSGTCSSSKNSSPDPEARESPLKYYWVPQAIAFGYYQLSWLLYVIRPAWSYRLNADFEDHAEHEYMEFVAEHPGWETEPFESAFSDDYGRFDSLADLFRQIGHDERVHKQESLAQAAASRFR